MIPQEMRLISQWCCSKSIDDKAPITPRGDRASVDDPSTWSTYDQCVASAYPLVGFILTADDPYTIIDCDDHADKPATEKQKERFKKIIKHAASYTERSISQRGCHVVIKGTAPLNFHRDNIELFSVGKYFILTGNSINDSSIAYNQKIIDTLCREYAAIEARDVISSAPSNISDDDLVRMASNAENGNKFNALCRGDWEMDYPSQSEADLALYSILCFYTRDDAQVVRLFNASALGKRDKTSRMARYNLRRARSQEPPRINTDTLIKNLTAKAAPANDRYNKQANRPPMPGLLGEISKYIYDSSVRPVVEISDAAARGLMAGIVGCAYNISGTGLNLYQIVIAGTGKGKEGGPAGIERLVSAIRTEFPSIDQRIGPGNFASGQAIIRSLDRHKCFVSVIGEFGMALQIMCDPRAPAHEKTKQRVYLDLFSKSGEAQVLRSTAYSDADKNTKTLLSPALSILGEGTPESFFDGLDDTRMTNGLIPRFSVMHYTGPRVSYNHEAFALPQPSLCKKIIHVALSAAKIEQEKKVTNVLMDAQAFAQLNDFNLFCDRQINETDQAADVQLWNRGHLKALKLAALCAVCDNSTDPVIMASTASWAIQDIKTEIESTLSTLRSGAYTGGNAGQEAAILKIMTEYTTLSTTKRKKYGVSSQIIKEQKYVTFDYLRRRTRRLRIFQIDRRGETRALRDLMYELVEAGVVDQLPKDTLYQKYGLRSPVFVLHH